VSRLQLPDIDLTEVMTGPPYMRSILSRIVGRMLHFAKENGELIPYTCHSSVNGHDITSGGITATGDPLYALLPVSGKQSR